MEHWFVVDWTGLHEEKKKSLAPQPGFASTAKPAFKPGKRLRAFRMLLPRHKSIIVGRARFTLAHQAPGAVLVGESEMHRESEMHHFKKIYFLYSTT